jgi:hypothetical protein|eukprot:COSAG06_NODE_2453_length_6854_cov_6.728463_6_plen_59_part_00
MRSTCEQGGRRTESQQGGGAPLSTFARVEKGNEVFVLPRSHMLHSTLPSTVLYLAGNA